MLLKSDNCPHGLTAMTLACRAGNPGSTPGVGVVWEMWEE